MGIGPAAQDCELDSRRTLARRLEGRANDVATGVLAELEGCQEATGEILKPDLLDAITRTDVEATRVVSRWIATGEGATADEMMRLGALGALVDRLTLASLVKAYLAWRDVTIQIVTAEVCRIQASGRLRKEVVAMVARSCDAALVGMAAQFDAERHRLLLALGAERDKLATMALHDALTGLPNRTLLSRRLEIALGDPSGRNGVAVAFVDLDRFKAVNDALGHDAGDSLLRAVSDRFLTITGNQDTLARVGGDEFVLLFARVGEASEMGDRVLEILRDPVRVQGHDLLVSASIGIAVRRNGDSAEDMLVHADAAMYAAKESGGSRFELFDDQIGALSSRRAYSRLTLTAPRPT